MSHVSPRAVSASTRRVTGITLATVVVALAAFAPTAAADSIAYVKDGDVWLASPDGARTHQVTRSGGYAYVSQADDGTMVALAPHERLHRLSRTGTVLADFTTMVSDGAPGSGPVTRFHGPFTPEISPDGTKVAYEWVNDSYEGGAGCTDTSVPPCFVFSQRQGVAVSHADRHTGPEAFGLLTGWIYPHWTADDVLLRSFSGTILNDDAVFTSIGPGKADRELDPWFFDESGFGVDDVELSRDLRTLVGVAGQADEQLRVYRTSVHPYGAPDWNHRPFAQGNRPVADLCARIDAPSGARFETPSLSPDGRGLAYGLPDGIHVVALPDPSAGCDGVSAGGRLVIPGARHADWGSADLPAVPGAGGPPSAGIGARLVLRVAPTTATKALRSGLALEVRTGAPGRVLARVMRGRRVVATARGVVRRSGVLRLRVPLRRAAVGPRRPVSLAVRVTFTPAGGAPSRRLDRRVLLRR